MLSFNTRTQGNSKNWLQEHDLNQSKYFFKKVTSKIFSRFRIWKRNYVILSSLDTCFPPLIFSRSKSSQHFLWNGQQCWRFFLLFVIFLQVLYPPDGFPGWSPCVYLWLFNFVQKPFITAFTDDLFPTR